MSKIRITLFVLCCLSIFACKNDLEINAPWIEIPVVYGLLDANTNVQYIRIQKTYQNDVNTSTDQGAKIADSLIFDSLRVTIKGSDGSFYTLEQTNDFPKNPGVFATEKNYLYRANFTPNVNTRYELVIFSPKSGKSFRGSTSIIAPNRIVSDSLLVRPQNILRLEFVPSPAAAHDAILRFYYLENKISNPTETVSKYIDFPFSRLILVTGSINLRGDVRGSAWINFLKRSLTVDNSVTRTYVRVDYISVGASADLVNYYSVSIPSASSVQKRTDYTNIPDALGIFSSRSFTIKNAPLRNDANDLGRDSSKIYLLRELPNFVF